VEKQEEEKQENLKENLKEELEEVKIIHPFNFHFGHLENKPV